MALLQKVKALKHFQYQKKLRVPGEEMSIPVEDAKAMIQNKKVEAVEAVKETKAEAKKAE